MWWGGRVCVDMLPGYKWKETATLSKALDFWSLGGSDVQYCYLWGELREGGTAVKTQCHRSQYSREAETLQQMKVTFNPSILELE